MSIIVKLLAIVISFGGGLTIGGAFAAFYTLLQLIPRLVQITQTSKYIKLYQNIFVVSGVIFTMADFYEFHINLGNFSVLIIALLMGTFIGVFSSALAEVLNVLPILSKKIKFKNSLKYIIYSLIFGKMVGSLYFWMTY